MGMVLPMNYAEIEQEEMMYLDGGANGWWNSVTTVGRAIDVALTLAGFGASVKAVNKAAQLLRNPTITRKIRSQVIKLFGVGAGSAFSTGINVALTIAGTSLGDMVAKGLDIVDGKRNGYVFG